MPSHQWCWSLSVLKERQKCWTCWFLVGPVGLLFWQFLAAEDLFGRSQARKVLMRQLLFPDHFRENFYCRATRQGVGWIQTQPYPSSPSGLVHKLLPLLGMVWEGGLSAGLGLLLFLQWKTFHLFFNQDIFRVILVVLSGVTQIKPYSSSQELNTHLWK